MRIYFLSSMPCALRLNGIHYGVTDTFERYVDVCLSDKIYAEFSPAEHLPIGFFITETITSQPPLGCEVYLLPDGIAIYAYEFSSIDVGLRPVAQAREGNVLATLFWQGKLQLSIEGPLGFFNATMPPCFDPCTLNFVGDLLLLKGENTLGVYSLTGKQLLFERFSDCTLTENKLNATIPLSNHLQRFAKCEWTLTNGECIQTAYTLTQATENALPSEDLLSYAFFECVLIGGNFAEFLADELQPDADNIRAFLGDFIAVTPTEKATVCGLVRVKKQRLFAVEYYEVEIRNGKIVDVKG